MKTQWFVFGILALLILSACDQQASTDVNAQAGADAAAAADDGASADTDASADAGADVKVSADANEFLKLLGEKARLEWKVNYDLSTKAEGMSTSSKMAMYLKGSDVRTDITVPMAGEMRSYLVDGDLVSCSKSGSTWSCTKFDSPKQKDNPDQADVEADITSDVNNYDIEADGTMAVAGTTAKCFRVVSKQTSEERVNLRECFSSEGAPLYVSMQSSVQGHEFSSEMKATSYSKTVASADLVPPAQPKAFDPNTYGGLGAGASAGADAGADADPCAACGYLSGDAKEQCLQYC